MYSYMDSFEERAKARRASWRGYVARSAEEAARLEREIEASLTGAERVEAIWGLVLRMPWGDDASEYRLDRSVARVERRRR
jgi:hypothetical protein